MVDLAAIQPLPIVISGVEKRFGRYPALDQVSLDIQPGELIALLGPSGSGKTTLLRVIAGLEFPDAGQVRFGERDVTFAGAAERRVGFVFQQYALFRHMTVARNVAFGLEVRKRADRPDRAETTRRVDELLKLVELDGLAGRYPAQLSGGQRQRVALARALAVEPQVLLLDEPFGALDATVRKALRRELRRIHDATGVTTIFVTHDQEEALELADRVAILNRGRIEQIGTPAEVHDAPASAFVTGFVGEATRFEGEVASGRFRSAGVTAPAAGVPDGPAQAYLRPHQLGVASNHDDGFVMHVQRVVLQGVLARVEGTTSDGRALELSLPRQAAAAIEPGQELKVGVTEAHVFPLTDNSRAT